MADVIPSPTFAIDFLYLGVPAGIVAGAALLGGAVAVFLKLRRRGRGRLASGAAAIAVFVAGDLCAYFLYVTFFWRSPSRDRFIAPPGPPASAEAPPR